MADRSQLRPLTGRRQSHPNDRNGREAERPIMRAMTIRHDGVWPKAVGPLPDTGANEADAVSAILDG